jgi:hypothetical protein
MTEEVNVDAVLGYGPVLGLVHLDADVLLGRGVATNTNADGVVGVPISVGVEQGAAVAGVPPGQAVSSQLHETASEVGSPAESTVSRFKSF